MGSGDLVGSQFQLTVSLRYAPAAGELDLLCDVFNRVSQILSDATEGRLSIGRVEIAPDRRASRRADIWIHPGGAMPANSANARLWRRGTSLDISQSHLIHPTVLVHELGHYLFDLGDEYGADGSCVHAIAAQASLMEDYGWGGFSRWMPAGGGTFLTWPSFFAAYTAGNAVFRPGQPSEFCHDGNHATAPHHPHNTRWAGRSCWSVITDDATHHGIPYGLTNPGPSGPRKRRPAAPPATVCVESGAVERSLLVVEPTPTLGPDPLLGAVGFWIDASRGGDELGVATGGEGLLPEPIGRVPSDPAEQERWRATWRAALAEAPHARRGVGLASEALARGLSAVRRDGLAARRQVVVIGDGGAARGEELLATVPDARASGVRLDLVVAGDESTLGALAEAALASGGRLLVLDPAGGHAGLGPPGTAPGSDGRAEAAADLIELAGESRENGGLIAVERSAAVGHRRRHPRAALGTLVARTLTYHAHVTEGSHLATLGAAWTGAAAPHRVEVRDPDGALVGRRSNPGGARRVQGTARHAFVQVEAPVPGRWTIRVAGDHLDAVRPIAHEVNPDVSLDVALEYAHVRIGEPFRLSAALRAPHPVGGARIVARVRVPGGSIVEIAFVEHTGAPGDPEPARTYTAEVETAPHGGGAYRIEVRAERAAGDEAIELDALYAGAPRGSDVGPAQRRHIPAIRRRTIITGVADAAGRTERDPVAGWRPVPSPA